MASYTPAVAALTSHSPYRFEAPWHAFEFAFHVLEVEANLVIVSMAWLTREEARAFSRFASEPDMETLTYWVQRLEPVIRAEQEEEIIFIFANRCGVEDDAVYAGTSAVLGIQNGEVSVYGLLGRGEKELLVVDTERPIFGKLVNRPGRNAGAALTGEPSSPMAARHETSGEGGFDLTSTAATHGDINGSVKEGGGEEEGQVVKAETRQSTGLLISPATDTPEDSPQESRLSAHSQTACLVGATAEQTSDAPSPKFAVNKANLAITSAEGADSTLPLSTHASRLSAYFADQDLATPPPSEPDGASVPARDQAAQSVQRLPTPVVPDLNHHQPLDQQR